ncbi:carbohydrate-binding protein [Cohnella hongkongensis]|uniref:Carbohydrate-binding protein n=1 Tax=Cohnella hongkongensis TaxID=178337 RepID=A0ABV9FAS7_9BACL
MKLHRLWIAFAAMTVWLAGMWGTFGANTPRVQAEETLTADYYVSPEGSDGNPGTLAEPFLTVAKARDTVRQQIAGGMTRDWTVMLRGGEYRLEETLAFNEDDSGRDGYRVVYRNYPGEEPVIVGGTRLTGWEPYDENIYKLQVGEGTLDVPEQLGVELLSDGGFEDGFASWTVEKLGSDAGDTATIVTSEAYSGDRSLHVRELNTNGNTALDVYQWIPIDPAKTYRYSFWAKRVDGEAGFRIMQATAAGSQITFGGFRLDAEDGDWKRYTGTIGPAGSGADLTWNGSAVKIRYELRNYPANNNYRTVVGEAYYDEASFREVTAGGSKVYSGLDFNSLFENGERSRQARYPNVDADGNAQYSTTSGNISKSRFVFSPGDIPVVSSPAELQVFLSKSWLGGTYQLSGVDYTNGIASLSSPSRYNIETTRYYVQGALELLDQPGEFSLDKRTGTLYYWPVNLPIEQQTIDVPLLRTVLQVRGSSPDTPVHDLVFQGLTVRNTDLPDNYFFERNQTQNALNKTSAVWIENARRIAFVRGKLYNLGMNALRLDGLAQYNEIKGNLIRDAGGTGIALEGPNAYGYTMNALTSVSANDHNVIADNHIYETGLFNVYDGYGIDVLASGDNTIAHNRIHDTTRGAIQIRNYWPDLLDKTAGDGVTVTMANVADYTHARNNVVEFNDVSRAITAAGDAGVIYAYQTGAGNAIRSNWVHDTSGQELYGIRDVHGIYLDNFADGFTVEGNLVTGLNEEEPEIPASGIFDNVSQNDRAPMGKNVFDNNFVIGGEGLERGFYLWEDDAPDELARNVVTDAKYFYDLSKGLPEDIIERTDDNLFYSSTGDYRISGVPGVSSLQDWRSYNGGLFDAHSVIENPQFVDPARSDYRLAYDSPALALGIRDIAMKDIGLTSDYPFADPNDPLERVFAFTATSGDRSWSTVPLGQQAQLKLAGRTAQGYAADLSAAAVAYGSDDETIATVDAQGVVTAVGRGVARVTVAVSLGGTVKTTVLDIMAGLDYVARTEVVEQNEQDLKPLLAQGLEGFYNPATSTVVYTSDDPLIASVDADGIVTGMAPGLTSVVAAVSEGGTTRYARFDVTVLANTLDQVFVSSDGALTVGASGLLRLGGTMRDGSAADLSVASVVYASSDPAVASVTAGGMVTVHAHGTAILTAEVTLDGVTKSGTLTVLNRSAFTQIEAESFDRLKEPVATKPDYIWNTHSNGWAKYDSVDFGDGAAAFSLNVAVSGDWAGGRVEVRLDAPDGTLAGTLTVASTGSFTTYQTQTAMIDTVTGVHDLYLVFPDKAGGTTGNMNWFSFTPSD